jgi:hypothetical protein
LTRDHRGGLVVAALLALLAFARGAHADAWTPVTFVGPSGAEAHGFASDAAGGPSARLLVGCEKGGPKAWRGVALLEPGPGALPGPVGGQSEPEVVTAFFGRAPVTSRWHSRATAEGLLSWPGSSEELRRSMLREDQTRGQATLQLEIRRGESKQRLTFGVGGLATHGAEFAAQCDGWGAETNYKRRERGW